MSRISHVENAGRKKLEAGKIMKILSQSLRKKEETLPSDTVNVLSLRQDKIADLGRRKSSSAELPWDEGRRVVELEVFAKDLRACEVCKKPLQLYNIVNEKRYGPESLLNISCSCGQLNSISTGNTNSGHIDQLTHAALRESTTNFDRCDDAHRCG